MSLLNDHVMPLFNGLAGYISVTDRQTERWRPWGWT